MVKVKKEQMLLSISAILILGMLLRFVYQPQIGKITRLKSELMKTSQELRESQMLIEQNPSKNDEGEPRQKFAIKNEVNEILSFLTESAEETDVTLSSVSQRSPVRKEFYEEIPIEIEFTAEYGKILDYLDRIGTFPKLLRIGNLEITRDEAALHRLMVRLLVKTYVLPE